MQKEDEASMIIILACRALLVKMLITLKPHAIFTLIGACKACVKSLNSIARTAAVHKML